MSKSIRGKTSVFEYVVQDNHPQAKLDMVLMHGFGADCTDLLGLYPFLSDLPIRRFIFPNGVMPANSVPTGRAWFPIDIVSLEKAMMTGSFRDMGGELPPALSNLSNSMEQALIEELHIDPANCLLGGFSQGAMMAANIMLNSTNDYAGLIQLSGTFLDRKNWTQKIIGRAKKIPVYVSHGKNDALLNPKDADDLAKCFYDNHYKLEYNFFEGGHEISMEVIESLKNFVRRL